MCSTCGPDVAVADSGAFGERMLQILNHGGLAMMISIGHRTGLFDALDGSEPQTSAQLAETTGLNERYVREWLGAMVTGQIIEFQAESGKYRLPAEHAPFLTTNGSESMASTLQWISVLGGVEDQIVDCFAEGGGVDYSAFQRFHTVMASESSQTVVDALDEHILPLQPAIMEDLEKGIDVADIGCGCGQAMLFLARQYPNSSFVGYDFSEEAISTANRDAEAAGLTNVRFEQLDVAQLAERERFDLITAFDSIHDQRAPDVVLERIHAALRSTGTFLMQDIAASSRLEKNLDHPVAPFLYTISTMHCMTVSLAQGGAGLGTCWGKELACEMVREAGFAEVEVKQLPHDILNYYYLVKKSGSP